MKRLIRAMIRYVVEEFQVKVNYTAEDTVVIRLTWDDRVILEREIGVGANETSPKGF